MKNTKRQPFNATGVACLLIGMLSAPLQAAPILELVPDASTVDVGGDVSVDVRISDLAGGIVSAYSLFVAFDPSVLAVTDVRFGTGLGDGATGLFCDPVFFPCALQASTLPSDPGGTSGLAAFSELSFLFDSELEILQGGSALTLATLSFSALAAGASALSFADFSPLPGLTVPAGDVKGFFGQLIDPLTLQGAQIGVTAAATAVDEPSTLSLLLLGLLAASVRRGRRTA